MFESNRFQKILCILYKNIFSLCIVERCSLVLVYHQLFGLKAILDICQAFVTLWKKFLFAFEFAIIKKLNINYVSFIFYYVYKKTVIVQNKLNLLLKIFLQTFLHYTYWLNLNWN